MLPSWDFPRSPVGARLLLRTGVEYGLPDEVCLAGTGLDEADLERRGQIEAGQELRIARNIMREAGDPPGLGARAGQGYTIEAVGVWGFAVLTSPTWRDALDVGARYFTLTTAFVRPEIVPVGDELRLILHDDEMPADVRDFLVERDLAAIAVLIAALVAAMPDARFETALEPARAALLSELLPGGEVVGGRPRHLIAGDREMLDTPLPQAEAQTWQTCKRQCQVLLDERAARTGTAAQVRSQLLAHPEENVSMAQVAARLHVDPRTLRRRLAAEGTSFRALRAEIHQTLAVELLGTVGLTVAQVAQRLGYADPAAFTHAFTRWTGTPPSAHRL